MPDLPNGKAPDDIPQTSAPDITDMPSPGIARHIAIIMDGNNRWAKQRALASLEGHRAGAKALRAVVEQCVRCGVQALTVFAFSSENWRRPPAEVRGLMELFIQALRDEVPELHQNDISVRFIGDLSLFDSDLQSAMAHANSLTAKNQRLVLSVAVNYGGRWDVANAAKFLAEAVVSGQCALEAIDEQALAPYLALSDLPDVDLCIRTGGEKRISNFLLWQVAYAELYFSDLFWPDFDGDALALALKEYSQRQRRFGRTGDQVEQAIDEQALPDHGDAARDDGAAPSGEVVC
jgi:undecaprenyl diphosphate synthase